MDSFLGYYTLVIHISSPARRRMGALETYFNHHALAFWLCLLVVVIAVAALAIFSSLRSRQVESRYQALVTEIGEGNVMSVLNEYMGTVRGISKNMSEMDERVTVLHDHLPSLVSHVGLVRFSPFHDTGGDQSFSLALLDGKGDGVVISALHSRQDHKLYAKPVVNRASQYPLTDEERTALSQTAAGARRAIEQ